MLCWHTVWISINIFLFKSSISVNTFTIENTNYLNTSPLLQTTNASWYIYYSSVSIAALAKWGNFLFQRKSFSPNFYFNVVDIVQKCQLSVSQGLGTKRVGGKVGLHIYILGTSPLFSRSERYFTVFRRNIPFTSNGSHLSVTSQATRQAVFKYIFLSFKYFSVRSVLLARVNWERGNWHKYHKCVPSTRGMFMDFIFYCDFFRENYFFPPI